MNFFTWTFPFSSKKLILLNKLKQITFSRINP